MPLAKLSQALTSEDALLPLRLDCMLFCGMQDTLVVEPSKALCSIVLRTAFCWSCRTQHIEIWHGRPCRQHGAVGCLCADSHTLGMLTYAASCLAHAWHACSLRQTVTQHSTCVVCMTFCWDPQNTLPLICQLGFAYYNLLHALLSLWLALLAASHKMH